MDAVNIPFYVHKVEVYHKMDHVDGLVSVSLHKKLVIVFKHHCSESYCIVLIICMSLV